MDNNLKRLPNIRQGPNDFVISRIGIESVCWKAATWNQMMFDYCGQAIPVVVHLVGEPRR